MDERTRVSPWEVLADLAAVAEEHDQAHGLLRHVVRALGPLVPIEWAAVLVPDERTGSPVPTACTCGDPSSPCSDGTCARAEAVVTAEPLAAYLAQQWGADGSAVRQLPQDSRLIVVPLREGGTPLGVLLLMGAASDLDADVDADVDAVLLRAAAGYLARGIARLRSAHAAAFAERCTQAIRRLFEEGAHASTVREAGEVLARATADAFATERAGMYVIDGTGRISEAVGVGITERLSQDLERSLVGKQAQQSPVWRATGPELRPLLVDDADTAPRRPGGFVESMGFQSYVAVPLLSADGPLGLIICGDTSPRRWTLEEAQLAGRLALEGALIVDSARLRATERARIDTLTQQAFHDSLTGLPNRLSLMDSLTHALSQAAGLGEQRALLLLDLNDFKQVNDTLGHHYGDLLLQQVATRLTRLLRGSDIIARLGGDEFAILLSGDADHDAAAAVARTIQRGFEQPFQLGDLSLEAVASIGVALYPTHGDDPTLLLQRADLGMYEAKRRRSGPVVYQPTLSSPTRDKLTLSTELRHAIDHGELVLHYQPKVDASTAAVTGVEALVRWQHPRRGLLGPDEFLPVAEATGLIDGLTQWVLREAARQWQQWRLAGVELDLSVNLSVRSLHDPGFLDDLDEVLQRFPVAAHLVLEITETEVMADPELATRVLNQIRDRDVRISVDDFGAGYSSLAYMRTLPVDELKIDRSLIGPIASNARDRAIVQTVISLAHCIGVPVVAEGVEDDATRDALADLGCDQLQGFHFSRPLSPDRFLQWLHGDEGDRSRGAASHDRCQRNPAPAISRA